MPPAVIAAGVGAAASIGGSMLSARSQRRSADRASDAQTAMGRENNALATQFRAENTANFQPWLNSGARANTLVDSFLYGPQVAQAPAPAQALAPAPTASPFHQNGVINRPNSQSSARHRLAFLMQRADNHDGGQRVTWNGPRVQTPVRPAPVRPMTSTLPAQNAMSGYEAFTASPYYQNPLREGLNALNTGYAANGMIESGAAMKGITKFGQDYAHGRMNEFIGMAERQSDRGMQGASAIAGVGQNALASMSANNANSADARSGAALMRGNANAGMYGNIAGGIAGVANALGSSYRAPAPAAPMNFQFDPNNPLGR